MSVLRQLSMISLFALPLFAGCDSGVSSDELGTVIFEVPSVAGSDQVYEMKELGPPLPEEEGPFGLP